LVNSSNCRVALKEGQLFFAGSPIAMFPCCTAMTQYRVALHKCQFVLALSRFATLPLQAAMINDQVVTADCWPAYGWQLACNGSLLRSNDQ